MSIENRDEFIAEITQIINSQKNEYNLLEVMGINRREVYICKILKSLIDPKSGHSYGCKFLELFFNEVLGITNVSNESISAAHVNTEETTNTNRRIDIIIKTDNYVIPIEVKIDADDRNSQCYDYYKYCDENKTKDQTLEMYYLTKNGSSPSENSQNGIHLNTISFEKDIQSFLDKCKKICKDNCLLHFGIITLQKSIYNFCESEYKDIDNLVNNNPEYLRIIANTKFENVQNYDIVNRYLNHKCIKLRQKYFWRVRNELVGNNIVIEEYKDRELSILIKNYGDFVAKLYFIIYPESFKNYKGKPVIGIQIWKDNDKVRNKKGKKELSDLIPELTKLWSSFEDDSLSAVIYNWVYIKPIKDEYNFLEIDDKTFELFDEKKMEELIALTVKEIGDLIDKININ